MRFGIMVVAATVAMAGAASGRGASPPDSARVSAAYMDALRAADSFLAAWSTRNSDAGMDLLSARLLSGDADHKADLRQYISGLSNPHHRAFEIGAGTANRAERVAFPVTLFELYTGERTGHLYRDTLEVLQERGEWRIDRLPRGGTDVR